MYNRYLSGESFSASPPSSPPPDPPVEQDANGRSGTRPLHELLGRLFPDVGKKNAGGLSGIFQSLKPDEPDKGDILLILILLYLFWESEDDELLIILGLLLLNG